MISARCVLFICLVMIVICVGTEAPMAQSDLLDSLESHFQANPGDSSAIISLIDLLIEQNDYERSQTLLEGLLSDDSCNAFVLYLYGNVCDRMDDLPNAAKFYEKSITCDLTTWQAYRDLAYLHDVLANYERMNELLILAVRHAPIPDSLYYDLGYSYDLCSQTDSATVYYYRALTFDSQDWQACNNLAALWGMQQEQDSAIYYADKALNRLRVCYNDV